MAGWEIHGVGVGRGHITQNGVETLNLLQNTIAQDINKTDSWSRLTAVLAWECTAMYSKWTLFKSWAMFYMYFFSGLVAYQHQK